MGLGTTCTTDWSFVGDFLLGAEDLRELGCTLLFPRDIVKQIYGRLTLPSPQSSNGGLVLCSDPPLPLSPVPQSSLTPTLWLMASYRGRRYQCRGRERRGEDHGHRWHREHTRRYGGGQRNWANIRGRRACWSLCSKSCKVSSTENITFIYFIRAALSLSRR